MHVDTNSLKLKVDRKFYGFSMVNNGCGQSALWTLNLTLSPEWSDEINWFFCMLAQIHTK